MTAEFTAPPAVSTAVLRAIRGADLIIYAPGSLYTSIIPILQIPQIAAAIRENRAALKILGANSWIQQGETDISLRNEGRGFLVSELIEAYDRNVPGGARGLFGVVLSANLEQIPSNILRNYALEGKRPHPPGPHPGRGDGIPAGRGEPAVTRPHADGSRDPPRRAEIRPRRPDAPLGEDLHAIRPAGQA